MHDNKECVKLQVLVLGQRDTKWVECNPKDTVEQLCKTIEAPTASTGTWSKTSMRVYQAKTTDGWLKSTDDVLKLSQESKREQLHAMLAQDTPLDPQRIVEECFDVQDSADAIHALAECAVESVAPALNDVEENTDEVIVKRWEQLNALADIILDRHPNRNAAMTGKNKKRKADNNAVAWTSVQWVDVGAIYALGEYSQPRHKLDDAEIDLLHARLGDACQVYPPLTTANDLQRMLLVATILEFVCARSDSAALRVNHEVHGHRVHFFGRLAFLVQTDAVALAITLAKCGNICQAMAHNLIALDVLRDVDDQRAACGIVTDYTRWVFLQQRNGATVQSAVNLGMENDAPDIDSLQKVAEMLVAIIGDSRDAAP